MNRHIIGENSKEGFNFEWNKECLHALDTLKEKLIPTLILLFPN